MVLIESFGVRGEKSLGNLIFIQTFLETNQIAGRNLAIENIKRNLMMVSNKDHKLTLSFFMCLLI